MNCSTNPAKEKAAVATATETDNFFFIFFFFTFFWKAHFSSVQARMRYPGLRRKYFRRTLPLQVATPAKPQGKRASSSSSTSSPHTSSSSSSSSPSSRSFLVVAGTTTATNLVVLHESQSRIPVLPPLVSTPPLTFCNPKKPWALVY